MRCRSFKRLQAFFFCGGDVIKAFHFADRVAVVKAMGEDTEPVGATTLDEAGTICQHLTVNNVHHGPVLVKVDRA